MKNTKVSLVMLLAALPICMGMDTRNTPVPPVAVHKHVILFIWDGLRPDSITATQTPNLYRLKQQGVWFSDNHSSYPTFTMMNAASFATGDLAGKTGFYGNTLWDPRASGIDSAGKPVNFNAPVFTEDYHILQDLHQPEKGDPLFFVPTLFSIAQKAGLTTATVGKSGPAFMQDYQQQGGMHGLVLDEKHIYPLEFAQLLQQDHYPLPALSPIAFNSGALALAADNGDPTAFGPITKLKAISGTALGSKEDFIYPDNITSDPSATDASPYSAANRYLMQTYLQKMITPNMPNLSVVWLRNPDTTEHNYGPGSPSYLTALHDQDQLLGLLLATLQQRHLLDSTDLIIASDHSHSSVSGPLTTFPLRSIKEGMPSAPNPRGYSVSGDIRPADLLSRAGFHAYDGQGCLYDPVLSGITAQGHAVYPIQVDRDGSLCKESINPTPAGLRLYTTPSYTVPTPLPDDAIIVAANGGSTYFYIPSHDPALIARLTRFLQSREEFGVVFVDNRYGTLPGTLPMSLVRLLNPEGRNPDVIVGSSFNDQAAVLGMHGIEFSSGGINRGMHGSFSRTDVHNTLLAVGPDFHRQFVDPLPTGNIDVAPTIAYLLNLSLPHTHGRVLYEALVNGKPLNQYSVVTLHVKPTQPASGLVLQLATDPNGKDVDRSKTHFTVDLQAKLLIIDGKNHPYFDCAPAIRY